MFGGGTSAHKLDKKKLEKLYRFMSKEVSGVEEKERFKKNYADYLVYKYGYADGRVLENPSLFIRSVESEGIPFELAFRIAHEEGFGLFLQIYSEQKKALEERGSRDEQTDLVQPGIPLSLSRAEGEPSTSSPALTFSNPSTASVSRAHERTSKAVAEEKPNVTYK